jgi:hypothetical protein
MADRIFPNRFQEDPLDSDLVFQGIDWDNFNQRLAEAKEPKENKGLKALIDAIGDEEVDRLQGEDHDDHDSESSYSNGSGMGKEAKKGIPEGLKKWMEENGKGKKKSEDSDDEDSKKCPDCDCDPCECDDEKADKGPMNRQPPKSKNDKKRLTATLYVAWDESPMDLFLDDRPSCPRIATSEGSWNIA